MDDDTQEQDFKVKGAIAPERVVGIILTIVGIVVLKFSVLDFLQYLRVEHPQNVEIWWLRFTAGAWFALVYGLGFAVGGEKFSKKFGLPTPPVTSLVAGCPRIADD